MIQNHWRWRCSPLKPTYYANISMQYKNEEMWGTDYTVPWRTELLSIKASDLWSIILWNWFLMVLKIYWPTLPAIPITCISYVSLHDHISQNPFQNLWIKTNFMCPKQSLGFHHIYRVTLRQKSYMEDKQKMHSGLCWMGCGSVYMKLASEFVPTLICIYEILHFLSKDR